MLSGKYVSTQSIVDKVYRDSGYTMNINFGDAIEWVAEALGKIDAPKQFTKQISCIEIDEYRGKLPCNFYQMIEAAGMWFDGILFPMRESSNTMHPVLTTHTDNINDEMVFNQVTSQTFNYSNFVNSSQPIYIDANGNPSLQYTSEAQFSFPKETLQLFGVPPLQGTYNLNEDFMFTSFKTGKVLISYEAYPVDNDGFPLIPDSERYREAVASYLIWRITHIGWRCGEVTDKVHTDAEQEWLWYCQSAANKARIPSIDQAQSWMNMMRSLIPRSNAHFKFFRNLEN